MIYKRTQWSAKAEYEAPRGERLGEPIVVSCVLYFIFFFYSLRLVLVFLFSSVFVPCILNLYCCKCVRGEFHLVEDHCVNQAGIWKRHASIPLVPPLRVTVGVLTGPVRPTYLRISTDYRWQPPLMLIATIRRWEDGIGKSRYADFSPHYARSSAVHSDNSVSYSKDAMHALCHCQRRFLWLEIRLTETQFLNCRYPCLFCTVFGKHDPCSLILMRL